MRRFTFEPEILNVIRWERYHHPHPRVQQRMEVLWLKSQNLTHEEIAQIAGVSRRTVQRYLDIFEQQGLDGLRRLAWKGKPSDLQQHAPTLEEHFLQHPPRSVAEAQATIQQLTGVQRGPTCVRTFLKKRSVCVGGKSG